MTMHPPDPRIDALWRALGTVIDPEIGLDVVTLGLIYAVEIRGDVAWITHSLTTRGCPMEGIIVDGIRSAGLLVAGISDVETCLVWVPEWHSGMIVPGAL